MDENEDDVTYTVVMNHEEQYSIWPAHRQIPAGWNSVGRTGPKTDCLAYIKEVWTDMRPLSLRKRMEQDEKEMANAPVFANQNGHNEGSVSNV
jgi:MbtH protein